MAASRSEIYLHLVWSTRRRLALITPEMQQPLYAVIQQEASRLRCGVLAVNGMPDHVHLALWLPTAVSVAQLMQRVKGISSTYARKKLLAPGAVFGWQDGFGAFSFSRSQRTTVLQYVRDQEQRHAAGRIWLPLEPDSPPVAMRPEDARPFEPGRLSTR